MLEHSTGLNLPATLQHAVDRGDPVITQAISYQAAVAEFYGVRDLVAVTNAHFTGDFEVMDIGGMEYLQSLVDMGATLAIPTTRNSTCLNANFTEFLCQASSLVEGELEVTSLLRKLGVIPVNTCIGYQTVYQPTHGEHVAWGDTGAVTYANSVLGARSNFEAGPASLYAGITGYTPNYGYHLDQNRRGNIMCRLNCILDDVADWGVLGALIGSAYRGYWNVPVIELGPAHPTPDALKHLAAALTSYGSIPMFHIVGLTPEAPTVEDAVRGRSIIGDHQIFIDDIIAFYSQYSISTAKPDLVVFTAPQLSLMELGQIVRLLRGRRIQPDVNLIVTTNSMIAAAAADMGLINALTQAGGKLITGTCWYLMDPARTARERGWTTVLTNSAKLANIIKAHGYRPILRRTASCIEAAITGLLS